MSWQSVKLESVAQLDRDSVHPNDADANTPYIGLEHIGSDGQLDSIETVSSAELKSNKFRFSTEHVLFGKLRPYLCKIARPDFSGVCSTDIIPLRPSTKLDRNYLYHFLRTPAMVDFATSRCSGANLPRLSPKQLAAFQIPLPPLAEQKRIAGILDAADALRAKRRESIEQLDRLIQATFLEMFGDPVTNPKGWDSVQLGTLINRGPQNGIYKPAKMYGQGTRILRIDGFYDGKMNDEASLKRVSISRDEVSKYSLSRSDIVINRVNSRSHLGKCALIPDLHEPVVFESNMMRFSVDADRVHPRFLTQIIQSPSVKKQILIACKDAVNQSSINQTDVTDFQILLPPLALQERFAACCYAIDLLSTEELKHLVQLDKLFASLQSQAFSRAL